jgi:hypothetical protein
MDTGLQKKGTFYRKSITYQNPTTVHLESAADVIKTNLEKMFDVLNRIKRKLLLCQDIELSAHVDWMIHTILKNKLNDVNLSLEDCEPDNPDFQKILDLLCEYSSDINFKINLVKLKSNFYNKKGSTIVNEVDLFNIFKKYESIFERNFDIFKLSNFVGRDNIMLTVCGNIFFRFDLFRKLSVEKFTNFIVEMKKGYKDNPYHNVIIFYAGSSRYRCNSDYQSDFNRDRNDPTTRVGHE